MIKCHVGLWEVRRLLVLRKTNKGKLPVNIKLCLFIRWLSTEVFLTFSQCKHFEENLQTCYKTYYFLALVSFSTTQRVKFFVITKSSHSKK